MYRDISVSKNVLSQSYLTTWMQKLLVLQLLFFRAHCFAF